MTPARRRWASAAAVPLSVAVLVAALRWGGAVTGTTIAGLPDAGPVTVWGLPVTRLLVDGAATLTAGWCVVAAFLLPGGSSADGQLLGPAAYRMLRQATWWATGWAAGSLALLWLTMSDLLGRPLPQVGAGAVWSLAVSVNTGQALLTQAVVAALVAAGSRLALTRPGAAVVAVLACVACLPPALTGHAAGAGNHQLAVTSLAVHILAAALWVGGLAAVLTLRRDAILTVALTGYSRLALGAFVAVAASGIASAAVRLGAVAELWHSRYGILVLGKAAALLTVGVLGALHRRRTLRAPDPSAFRRLAAGELLVFGATVGLAVALSRTPTPVPTDPVDTDPVTDLLGFPAPPPVSAASLLWPPLLDAFFLAVVVLGAAAYLTGVWRLHRAGHRWPPARTASWLAGVALLGAVTCTGFGRYAYVLFSFHMAQHLILAMVVPILLVGGAPVTLALRALRRPADPAVRGARDWLLLVLHSRAARLLTHPLVALGVYVVSLYALYFSTLLGTIMRYHLGHLLMLTHFVLTGFLFFWVLIGVDPGRRRTAPPVLVLVHLAGMAFHAFLGVALMQSRTLIAPDWYTSVHPAWASTLLADQRTGAGLAWAFGEIPAVAILILLVVRWVRADEREQRRLDRAADRAEATGEEDDLARYNDFLRRAAADRR